MKRTLAVILAGGEGERLSILSSLRAKPAVPFGGKYRIIDFVLSNFINSGIYSIYVLTQFRSQSLLQHLNEGWQTGGLLKNQFIIPVRLGTEKATNPFLRADEPALAATVGLSMDDDPVAVFAALRKAKDNFS